MTESTLSASLGYSHRLTTNQSEFSDFLADLWEVPPATTIESHALSGVTQRRRNVYSPTLFCHEYPITGHRVWRAWKAGEESGTVSQRPSLADRRGRFWWCGSLREAEQHYSWTAIKFGSFPMLASKLQTAMKSGSDAATRSVCDDIFKWGGVARKTSDRSRLWVDSAASAHCLIKKLRVAARVLQPARIVRLSTFCRGGLLMNSAMTKIYAAVDPANIVIYDGRVGAALCLLVRSFLEQKKCTTVPHDLGFLWGPSQGGPVRNPSSGSLVFKSLNQHGIGDRVRAETARRANLILSTLTSRLKAKGLTFEIGDVERVLFMIGYDIQP